MPFADRLSLLAGQVAARPVIFAVLGLGVYIVMQLAWRFVPAAIRDFGPALAASGIVALVATFAALTFARGQSVPSRAIQPFIFWVLHVENWFNQLLNSQTHRMFLLCASPVADGPMLPLPVTETSMRAMDEGPSDPSIIPAEPVSSATIEDITLSPSSTFNTTGKGQDWSPEQDACAPKKVVHGVQKVAGQAYEGFMEPFTAGFGQDECAPKKVIHGVENAAEKAYQGLMEVIDPGKEMAGEVSN